MTKRAARPRSSAADKLAARLPSRHWDIQDIQRNMDELADPSQPMAFPAERPTDLLGRIRVRLCAEGGDLVGYGFGGQRIAVPVATVGAVRTVARYRLNGTTRGESLLVLDRNDRVLLRARGRWETYGEVARVCQAARLPAPRHVFYSATSSTVTRGGKRRRTKAQPPRYLPAPGCQKLRTVPRTMVLRLLGALALLPWTVGAAVFLGILPAVLLPEWTGAVRQLAGITGAALGFAAGCWLFAAVTHVLTDAVRWAAASRAARTPAPTGRFFQRRPRSRAWSVLATAGMAALVPALIGWGPGVGIASVVHGLRDSNLVAQLRGHGVATPGFLIDEQDVETQSNGDIRVTDVPTLAFLPGGGGDLWKTTDPAIGGRPLPLDPADPIGTREPLTVVYLPSDPGTAAASRQLAGSVWHGAPTTNVITGSLFTLILPLLVWRVIYRIRRRRWLRDADLLDGIGG